MLLLFVPKISYAHLKYISHILVFLTLLFSR